MVEWRPLIVSIFFALAVYVVSLLTNINGSYLAVLLGGVAVGYMIDGTMKDGVIHGAILGVVIGLITLVILIIQIASYGLLSMVGSLLQSIIILLVIEIVIGLIGGILGALMNSESLISVEPEK